MDITASGCVVVVKPNRRVVLRIYVAKAYIFWLQLAVIIFQSIQFKVCISVTWFQIDLHLYLTQYIKNIKTPADSKLQKKDGRNILNHHWISHLDDTWPCPTACFYLIYNYYKSKNNFFAISLHRDILSTDQALLAALWVCLHSFSWNFTKLGLNDSKYMSTSLMVE